MRRVTALFATVAISIGLADVAAAQKPKKLPEPGLDERIRQGVTVAGVDVGTLTVREAEAKLRQALDPLYTRDVVLVARGKRFVLKSAAIGFRFNAKNSALKAFYAGRDNPQKADGSLPPAAATPSVSFKRVPLWKFVTTAAARSQRRARDASMSIRVTKIRTVKSRYGQSIEIERTVKTLQKTLSDPVLPREVVAKPVPLAPKVTLKALRKANPAVITIDRGSFRLRLFKGLRHAKTYRIATGLPGYTTPAGNFNVQTKQVNPVWSAPNSPWAGELAGKTVPGGAPNNPLRARWIGVAGAIGIHGTGAVGSIGTRASHGCIRLTVPDVINLFNQVSIGTPVVIR